MMNLTQRASAIISLNLCLLVGISTTYAAIKTTLIFLSHLTAFLEVVGVHLALAEPGPIHSCTRPHHQVGLILLLLYNPDSQ